YGSKENKFYIKKAFFMISFIFVKTIRHT
ncbi:MAG: hypothetical protein PWR26_738, partial [Methanosarcinales archaeon]|nr:hypothetical protein [Methanosarcinales archaeon]